MTFVFLPNSFYFPFLHTSTKSNLSTLSISRVPILDLPRFKLNYCDKYQSKRAMTSEIKRGLEGKSSAIKTNRQTVLFLYNFTRHVTTKTNKLTSFRTNLVQNSKTTLAASHWIASFDVIQRAAIPATIFDTSLNGCRSGRCTAVCGHCCRRGAHVAILLFI
jgi:hypothetical protein